jgi:hypothetical protein
VESKFNVNRLKPFPLVTDCYKTLKFVTLGSD